MTEPKTFMLAGTTVYANRGCEAIVRGTTRILRRTFGEDIRFITATFGMPDDLADQMANETDPAISHISLTYDRFSLPWALDQCNRRLGTTTHGRHWAIRDAVKKADVALGVGGDNYSLDYGFPETFFLLDRYLQQQGVPVFLWGASVGPFTRDADSATRAHAHLTSLDGIYVRESRSVEYLGSHGIRTRMVSDPAFAMEPVQPPAEWLPQLPDAPIGLNFSPLMARYVTGGDRGEWVSRCARATANIVRAAGERVILIPHVFQRSFQNDDGEFLTEVADLVRQETGFNAPVISRQLSAAQMKWVISRCSILVGARTHATIASLGSCVPTLSLAYSVKALGINHDLFGNLDYCMQAGDMDADTITARTLALLQKEAQIRDLLRQRIPDVILRAFAAGDYLREDLATARTRSARGGIQQARAVVRQ